MGQKADTAQKATAAIKNLFSVGSDVHSGLALAKSFLFGRSRGSGDSSKNEGLQADVKGSGQVDERLFHEACAHAEQRLVKEFKLTEHDARRRIHAIQKEANKLDPVTHAVVMLTIGLEQTVREIEIPQGNDKDGKKKEPKKEKAFQNFDGQDIIIMIALHNDRNFTRDCFKAMARSNEILPYRLKQIEGYVKKFNDGAEQFFAQHKYETRGSAIWDAIPIVNLFTTRRK